MRYKHLFLYLGIVLFLACDRPECENTNAIFDTHAPHTAIYKAELAQQLQTVNSDKLRYWLQKYENTQHTESLYFYVQGDGLCAVLHMTMTQWQQMEAIRANKAVGRRGAEFIGLEYDIVTNNNETQFIYKRFNHLLD